MSSFITRNKPEWGELEALLKRARKSVKRLSLDEMKRLDVLYRRATVHLSQVRSRTSDRNLINYLNGLTSTAHSIIYLPPQAGAVRGGFEFLREGLARTIARNWIWHAISACLLLAGAGFAAIAGSLDVVALYALMPAGDPRGPGASRETLLEILRSGRDQGSGGKFVFAAFLFSHNFKVGLLSMALGILAAVPTVILIIYNGMILGAFATVHHQASIVGEMWAWILPHGITEIGAIVLCGGIGLQLGWAIVSPGMYSRSESLKAVSAEVARTAVGAGFMLIFAAIIESYLRQSELSTAVRLSFAAATAVFWIAYIAYGFVCERAAVRQQFEMAPVRSDSSGEVQ
jgi:uncharacterized membrane protein SpoIIM required for sporulation